MMITPPPKPRLARDQDVLGEATQQRFVFAQHVSQSLQILIVRHRGWWPFDERAIPTTDGRGAGYLNRTGQRRPQRDLVKRQLTREIVEAAKGPPVVRRKCQRARRTRGVDEELERAEASPEFIRPDGIR